MERRHRPAFTPFRRLGYWIRDYGGAILLAVAVCVLFAGLLRWKAGLSAGPETYEEAEVLRFGYYERRYVQLPLVIVRTRDGAVRQLEATRQSLRYCRRGDAIMLVRRGAGLFVHRQGCLGSAASIHQPR
jgi:hypothetical protein